MGNGREVARHREELRSLPIGGGNERVAELSIEVGLGGAGIGVAPGEKEDGEAAREQGAERRHIERASGDGRCP